MDVLKLAIVDDYSTLFSIDSYFMSASHKIRPRRGNDCAENRQILLDFAASRIGIDEAITRILSLKRVKRAISSRLKGDQLNFIEHITMYLKILEETSNCKFDIDNRFPSSNQQQFKVVANKVLKGGQALPLVCAKAAPLDLEKLRILEDRNDFSIMNIRGREHLTLGPLAFVNHCCVPNCEYLEDRECPGKILMRVLPGKRIKPGEEVTCSYGRDFWGSDDECLCRKCKHSRLLSRTSSPHLTRSQVRQKVQEEEEECNKIRINLGDNQNTEKRGKRKWRKVIEQTIYEPSESWPFPHCPGHTKHMNFVSRVINHQVYRKQLTFSVNFLSLISGSRIIHVKTLILCENGLDALHSYVAQLYKFSYRRWMHVLEAYEHIFPESDFRIDSITRTPLPARSRNHMRISKFDWRLPHEDWPEAKVIEDPDWRKEQRKKQLEQRKKQLEQKKTHKSVQSGHMVTISSLRPKYNLKTLARNAASVSATAFRLEHLRISRVFQ